MTKSNSHSPTPSAIKAIDSATCNEIMQAVDEALAPVADRFGISLQRCKGRYSPETVKLTVQASVIGESGLAETAELGYLREFLDMYGLPADAAGKVATDPGTLRGDWQLIGRSPRSRKYPLLARSVEDPQNIRKLTLGWLRYFVSRESFEECQAAYPYLWGGKL